ncbi:MAG TPA: hypothetical protein VD994_04555 [Prosthecobacter sp.]|nr:hypothetical protein [Prosthecobacter sp.]
MTIPTSVLAKMAVLGFSSEQAEAVAAMLSEVETATRAEAESAVEESKEKARARWRKWKEGKPTNVSKRLPTTANASQQLTGAGDAPVEDKPLKQQIEPKKENKTPSGDVAEFMAELSPDLDAVTLDALVKHRRLKRAQVTGHSARLFRRDATACGLSVAEAADTCISRNWITVKAEWLAPNARGSPRPDPVIEAANRLMAQMDAADANSTSETESDYPAPLRLSAYS